jgi:hypothetical protein
MLKDAVPLPHGADTPNVMLSPNARNETRERRGALEGW